MHVSHRTPLGVADFDAPDRLTLDAVLLSCKEDYDEVVLKKYDVGRCGCVIWQLSNEYLDIIES